MATNEHVEPDIRVKCAVKLLDSVVDKDSKVEEEKAPGSTTNLILDMRGVPTNDAVVRQD